ncbi:MAG: hypothetical protein GX537_09640 [Actinobacteria bacterium]|nr:hypothetical protein [Actinomycetota bacterium]
MARSMPALLLACAALVVGISAAGCSSDATSSDAAPQVTPSQTASPSLPPVTPSPATDWKETKTYRNDYYGFSFEYDSAQYYVEELEDGPDGGFVVYVLEDAPAGSPRLFWVRPVSKPRYLASAPVGQRALRRLLSQYLSCPEPEGGEVLAASVVEVAGQGGVVVDGVVLPTDAAPEEMQYRMYAIPNGKVLCEASIGAPAADWRGAWQALQGIVASLRVY